MEFHALCLTFAADFKEFKGSGENSKAMNSKPVNFQNKWPGS
jgi:hypothetical protein